MDEVDLPENEFDIFISLLSAYCAANNLDFIVSKAILSVKPGGVLIFSISNAYIDVTDRNYTLLKEYITLRICSMMKQKQKKHQLD